VEIDWNAHYTVEGWSGGIAFYLLGPAMIRDSDYEWTGMEYPDPQMVRAVMVGDDKVHTVDKDDLRLIADDDYCHECGQIGCTADGR